MDENDRGEGREWEMFPDMLTECAGHSSVGLRSRTLEAEVKRSAPFIGAPRVEGGFPFTGENRCRRREWFMGVNKVEMAAGLDGGLSSWLAEI